MFFEFILTKNQFQKNKNQNIPIHFLIFFIFQFCLWNWKMKNEKLPKFALFFNQKTNYTFGTWINNPCMESIIQKINFLKNKNCIFPFFKFWNMDLNSDSHLPKKFFIICLNHSPSKMMKNAFYIILKALFVLKIFKFLSWLFRHVEKAAELER